jgi:hypothetical protein
MSRITSVEQRQSGLYVIRASDGVRYATKNPWLASLAQRAKDKGAEVTLQSGGGWYYRELRHVLFAAEVHP